MAAKTDDYSALYYISRNTSSVTVDVTALTSGPRNGYGTATTLTKQVSRALLVTSVAAGTTLEVTRADGTQVVLTRNAQAGVEYPVQVKKVLPATTVSEYILLW